MKAVILSAGPGTRLRTGENDLPKPLTPLFGLTLVERAILSCNKAGVREFLVVVGSQKETLIPHLEELKERHRLSIQMVENPAWELGNGTSVLACEPYLDEPFLLIMGDHLFDPQILQRLMEEKEGELCWLAVDTHLESIRDIEEATKVWVEDNRITAIGKDISSFNGVDTGLFLCQPSIFEALRAAQAEGDFTLSGGVRKLIEKGKMAWVSARGLFWHDIDTKEHLQQARTLLLKALTKPQEDGWVASYLNRPLSRRISGYLAEWGLSPNLITVCSFLLSLAGGSLFALGNHFHAFLAGILVQLASVIDGCDGEVARLKLQTSHFGAWFDTLLDRYGEIAIVAGITYGFGHNWPPLPRWVGAFLAITGFIMASYIKKEFTLRYHSPLPEGHLSKLVKRDLRLFALFFGALAGYPFRTMVMLGLLSHLWVLWSLLTIRGKSKN